jgi:lysophospholipase L1-like esterase
MNRFPSPNYFRPLRKYTPKNILSEVILASLCAKLKINHLEIPSAARSMNRFLKLLGTSLTLLCINIAHNAEPAPTQPVVNLARSTFIDASKFGFSPAASGLENSRALQAAVDVGGTITVATPGIYKVAATLYIGSNTSLVFGNGVILQKVDEQGPFTHVILNKGALTKTYDEHISIEGLHIEVNGVDKNFTEVYGLRGQLAFFYIKDLSIDRFRCYDLGKAQFCIHICTFEDVLINDVIIKGDKDGVHFGRGKRFRLSNAVFETLDDAVALNAHDYATSNPELGWIEDGVIENCHDKAGTQKLVGFFCRILAGSWTDWKSDMEVQQSDTVVSNGRLYRVQMQADGTIFKSTTRPTHESGSMELDGIRWGVVQNDVTRTAGVRNVTFRDIFLEKPRTGFSIHFDNDKYSRSYYPGAETPRQERIVLENVHVLYDDAKLFASIGTPVDSITILNSSTRNSTLRFIGNKALSDFGRTHLTLIGCRFENEGPLTLVTNHVPAKRVSLKTSSSIVLRDSFTAKVEAGSGSISVVSDLPGLQPGITPAASDKTEETDPRLRPTDGKWGFIKSTDTTAGLPRVLLIGDSIMGSYRKKVTADLAGKAVVDTWQTGLHEASKDLHELLRKALANGPYAVVVFNIGLHGWQKDRVSDEQYEPLMRKYVSILREGAPTSRLIWANITQVTVKGKPTELDPVINPTIVTRNAIASRIMAENKIDIVDLYGVLKDKLELGAGDQFHWTKAGADLHAQAITEAVGRKLAP